MWVVGFQDVWSGRCEACGRGGREGKGVFKSVWSG